MKEVRASMAGTVLQVLVTENEVVGEGQDVIILESMKMEVPQNSHFTGKVVQVHVGIGDFVNEGDLLVSLE